MRQDVVLILALAGIGAWFLFRNKDTAPAQWRAPMTLPPDPWEPVLPSQPPAAPELEEIERKVTENLAMPRGIRNHNPMNLRYYAPIKWNGQLGDDGDGYAKFDDVISGIRAGVLNLLNGYFDRGINTPSGIIARYAPSHENPTDQYAHFIARQMGVGSNDPIEPTRQNLLRLTKAIIQFENGTQPYRDATILAGIDKALAAR